MPPEAMREREKKIRADIEAQFALKKECERRALAIVHRMLESPKVEEEDLKNAANSINPDYYRDIVIERGIASYCGYPVCPNELPSNMTRQTYRVSTLTNTVYDITERVNFCSNHCFKASKYFANQIPSEPLWTRDVNEPVHISLLPREESTSMPESSVFGGTEIAMTSPAPVSSARTTLTTKEAPREVPRTDDINDVSALDAKNADIKRVETGPGKSALEEYRSLVGEAKLEMIKHLLFDKESGLREKMVVVKEEEKKVGLRKPSDGERKDELDVECESAAAAAAAAARSKAEKSANYPVILERNLEHKLSTVKIVEEGDEKSSNDVDGAREIGSNDVAIDASIDPFLDHIRTESEMNQRLTNKKRSSQLNSNGQRQPPQQKKQRRQQRRKKVSFCDSIHFSDDSPSRANVSPTQRVAPASAKLAVTPESPASTNSPSPPVHPLDPIWHALRSWTTRLTVMRLWSDRLNLNDQLEKQKLEERVDDIMERVEMEEKSSEKQNAMCNVDANRECKRKSPRKKPIPDFDQLKTEQAFNEEKVVEFFKASFKLPTSVEIVETGGEAAEEVNDVKERITLPPTDRLSQVAIRRNLVLDRLLVVLPDFLSTMELTLDQVLDDLKSLIETLNLESDTIIFRPGQWAVVAVMLLKMASIRSGLIWDRVHRPKSCDILAKALDEIGIRLDDVDNLVATLTNPESLQEERGKS